MRKRMLAMLLACCLIGGTLSGCGGKTENSKENSQASAETEKTEQEDTSGEKEQPENITIEFFNQKQEEAAQQAYRNAAEDFHKEYPYITIEINTVPDSDKVLVARMAADDVPVVFHRFIRPAVYSECNTFYFGICKIRGWQGLCNAL